MTDKWPQRFGDRLDGFARSLDRFMDRWIVCALQMMLLVLIPLFFIVIWVLYFVPIWHKVFP